MYFSSTGQVVGQASMDCQGNLHETGVRTNRYSVGYALCLPND